MLSNFMLSYLKTRLKRLGTETGGQEIAEAAIVLPLVFLILMGIFWFGRAYNIYATVTHAAAEGARVAAMPTCATCTNAFPANTTVVSTVSGILQASHLDPAQIGATSDPLPAGCTGTAPPPACLCPGLTPPAACGSSGNVRICRGVQLNDSTSSPQVCGTMVSFQYPYQFFLPFTSLNFQLIQLPAVAEARVEY
jgi:TadE-like protein